MLTLASHADKVAEALVRNIITLASESVCLDDEKYAETGRDLLRMLADPNRLLPAYWGGGNKHGAEASDALDDYAMRTRKLYFSVRLHPEVSVAIALRGSLPVQTAQIAKQRCHWIPAESLANPSRELQIEIGMWLYAIRQDATNFCIRNKIATRPYVAVGSIHAS